MSSKSQPGRRRTITVTDAGQTGGMDIHSLPIPDIVAADSEPQWQSRSPNPTFPAAAIPPPKITTEAPRESTVESPETPLLSAGFMPKFKTALHLRDDSAGTGQASDAASIMTGRSGVMSDDASTRAVFAAPGVIRSKDQGLTDGADDRSLATTTRPGSPLANETRSVFSDLDGPDGGSPTVTSRRGNIGYDSPRSQRSLERLQSHQQDEGMGRMEPLRSPSSTAVVRMEGIASLVDESPDQESSRSPSHDGASDDDLSVMVVNGKAEDIEHEADPEANGATHVPMKNPLTSESNTTTAPPAPAPAPAL